MIGASFRLLSPVQVGVYMPLFLPATLPLLQALVAEFRRWLKRRAECKKARQQECQEQLPHGSGVEQQELQEQ